MTDLVTKRRAPILDGRLSAAMELAENCRVFADIGADHGRLSTVMLLQDENRYGIEKISVKVGENSIMVDNEEITFEKPVVNVANIFRAPLEFVDKLGFDLEYIYVGTYGTSYSLSMPNPNYIAE